MLGPRTGTKEPVRQGWGPALHWKSVQCTSISQSTPRAVGNPRVGGALVCAETVSEEATVCKSLLVCLPSTFICPGIHSELLKTKCQIMLSSYCFLPTEVSLILLRLSLSQSVLLGHLTAGLESHSGGRKNRSSGSCPRKCFWCCCKIIISSSVVLLSLV